MEHVKLGERLRNGIKIQVDFDVGGGLLVKFHARENFYSALAEHFKTYLQVKPYGNIYNKFYEKIKLENRKITFDEEMEIYDNIINKEKIEFEDLDRDDVNNFPPYILYHANKIDRFRR